MRTFDEERLVRVLDDELPCESVGEFDKLPVDVCKGNAQVLGGGRSNVSLVA